MVSANHASNNWLQGGKGTLNYHVTEPASGQGGFRPGNLTTRPRCLQNNARCCCPSDSYFLCVYSSVLLSRRNGFLLQAASLSITNEFKSGRLLAYKLMCSMTVCRQHMPLTQEYLTHFYRLMHIGLTGTDQVS